MCWPNRRVWLQALAVPAAFTFASLSLLSQIPVTAPADPDSPAGQAPTAVTAIADPIQVSPQPPESTEDLGDSLMSHQRYQAAIEAYRKAPRINAAVWNKMGISYQMMFNGEQALRCYQSSLKLEPHSPQVLNNLGTIYDSMKEYSNAERMYHRALKADPQSAMIFKNLGTNLLAQHKYKKGWEAYKTALEIDPHIFQNTASPRVQNPASVEERGAMNYYMAKGCVRAGMSDCAIDYLRMALNEGFTNPKKIEADSEFAALRGIPAFQQLLAAQRQQ